MKKVMPMAIAVLFAISTVFAADLHPGKTVADTSKTKKIKPFKVGYTCKMHPEVLSDKPGKCPKCGMVLVKKEPGKKAAAMKM